MAQNSWPFYNGSTGTPVLEDQWSIMARRFAQSGVESYANNLEVYGDSSGRQVKIKTGRATVRGHWYENTAEVTLAIAANTSGNPRIDRIVLKLDPSVDSIVLAVVQGTAAGSPSAPSLTQTDVAVYEMTLAQVAVANGATTITAGNVTDERTFVDGVWQSYTPTLAQGATTNIAKSVGYAKYTRVGKIVICTVTLTASAAGTGASIATISLPVTAAATGLRIGAGMVYDASTTTRYTGMAELTSTTTVSVVGDWSAGSAWGFTPNVAIASSDQLAFTIIYEAA